MLSYRNGIEMLLLLCVGIRDGMRIFSTQCCLKSCNWEILMLSNLELYYKNIKLGFIRIFLVIIKAALNIFSSKYNILLITNWAACSNQITC